LTGAARDLTQGACFPCNHERRTVRTARGEDRTRLGPTSFGIFDTFPDDSGRQAHLQGAVASALKEKGPELLAEEPSIEPLDILAAKLPALAAAQ